MEAIGPFHIPNIKGQAMLGTKARERARVGEAKNGWDLSNFKLGSFAYRHLWVTNTCKGFVPDFSILLGSFAGIAPMQVQAASTNTTQLRSGWFQRSCCLAFFAFLFLYFFSLECTMSLGLAESTHTHKKTFGRVVGYAWPELKIGSGGYPPFSLSFFIFSKV